MGEQLGVIILLIYAVIVLEVSSNKGEISAATLEEAGIPLSPKNKSVCPLGKHLA